MKDNPTSPERQNHLVAIVEGDRSDAEMLHRFLRLIGIDAAVIEPDSGALDTIRRETPDVVVVDFDLPALRGVELAREIGRSLPSAGIVFSSRRAISSRRPVVQKPYFSVEELLRLAEIVLNR